MQAYQLIWPALPTSMALSKTPTQKVFNGLNFCTYDEDIKSELDKLQSALVNKIQPIEHDLFINCTSLHALSGIGGEQAELIRDVLTNIVQKQREIVDELNKLKGINNE